ncbi:hypothetical protein [Kitasatospora sp. CB01950]|uniref:hypothetical protein n=1 Tax=Kitasatospora sp. CB01950 TaxID=1703930 RepID=UPI00093BBE8D
MRQLAVGVTVFAFAAAAALDGDGGGGVVAGRDGDGGGGMVNDPHGTGARGPVSVTELAWYASCPYQPWTYTVSRVVVGPVVTVVESRPLLG